MTSSCLQGNDLGSGIKFRSSGLEAGAFGLEPSCGTLALCVGVHPLYTSTSFWQIVTEHWMVSEDICDLMFCSNTHRRL